VAADRSASDVNTPMTGGGRLVTAGRAHFSWDDLDRLLSAAIGETPAVLRRRLPLERPA
jgi:hypothetical protein